MLRHMARWYRPRAPEASVRRAPMRTPSCLERHSFRQLEPQSRALKQERPASFVLRMESFAQVLESAMREPFSSHPPGAPLERAIHAFSDQLAEAEMRGGDMNEQEREFVLGVDVPRSLGEVKRAFRRRVMETHPDCPGGSHEAFLRTKALFDAACQALAS